MIYIIYDKVSAQSVLRTSKNESNVTFTENYHLEKMCDKNRLYIIYYNHNKMDMQLIIKF